MKLKNESAFDSFLREHPNFPRDVKHEITNAEEAEQLRIEAREAEEIAEITEAEWVEAEALDRQFHPEFQPPSGKNPYDESLDEDEVEGGTSPHKQ